MEYNIIDARGRSCPEPVIMTKQILENYNGEIVKVLVDTMVAVENIKRYAGNQGFLVEVEEAEDEYALKIRK
ncbi:sulfurtransferase TusA family protein [Alkaliphilus peptidifermentans]|uniref:TusA-related sulfurtransferase n=1 Tax=Alkaliphilus peptidifermentans DSM 18978 TaxID=1120976 RepID=A0A1G5K1N6_9FIRM|nr:sulfurtransferase TusA family protein [Alkaliphilus peptidifermentans]SCY94523.1 TusA-related sulfurtransferase [Alkaliphilus peptidifermentans DSM 18978]